MALLLGGGRERERRRNYGDEKRDSVSGNRHSVQAHKRDIPAPFLDVPLPKGGHPEPKFDDPAKFSDDPAGFLEHPARNLEHPADFLEHPARNGGSPPTEKSASLASSWFRSVRQRCKTAKRQSSEEIPPSIRNFPNPHAQEKENTSLT